MFFSEDRARFVCGGFDLQHCAVSVRIHSDLAVQVVDHRAAFDALDLAQLRLSNMAFTAGRNPVDAGMRRILKYIERGYRFPGVNAVPRSICTLSSACLAPQRSVGAIRRATMLFNLEAASSFAGSLFQCEQEYRGERALAGQRGWKIVVPQDDAPDEFQEYDYRVSFEAGTADELDPIHSNMLSRFYGSASLRSDLDAH